MLRGYQKVHNGEGYQQVAVLSDVNVLREEQNHEKSGVEEEGHCGHDHRVDLRSYLPRLKKN